MRIGRRPAGWVFTAVVAEADNIIIPRVFAEGWQPRLQTVVVPSLGHMGLLFSPQVYRLVAERLAAPLDGGRGAHGRRQQQQQQRLCIRESAD